MDYETKQLLNAIYVIVGTCIGAGFLGIPYVAAQSGYFMALLYLFVFGLIILLINLYFGEIILRTKKDRQLIGYAEKYLGSTGSKIMRGAVFFAIYSAIIAYMIGVGQSISFLIFENMDYTLAFGALFGFFMSYLLYNGLQFLKKFEKVGVLSILALFVLTFFMYIGDVNLMNLFYINEKYVFLPIGVILFSLIEFYALPEVRIILQNHENLLKKAIIYGTMIPVVFYALFTLVVVGFKGTATPEISTFALGNIFVLVGILAMFTSYLSLGNSLIDSYKQDLGYQRKKGWFYTAILPIIAFIILYFMEFISFIDILSVGGVIAGGTMVLLVLIISERSKILGNRTPEYIIKRNGLVVSLLGLIFILGIVLELARVII